MFETMMKIKLEKKKNLRAKFDVSFVGNTITYISSVHVLCKI